jgi:predicted secreted acid phosphatase
MCAPLTDSRFHVLAEMSGPGEALQWALAFVGAMRRLVKKPAVAVDVDATLLNQYTINGKSFTKRVVGFHPFCEACHAHGVAVFVITARPEFKSNREWTLKQIRQCGLYHVEETYMRPEMEDPRIWKKATRDKIRSDGYNILLSIGDQWHDITATPPAHLNDWKTLVGDFGDGGSYGIKFPSEYEKPEGHDD